MHGNFIGEIRKIYHNQEFGDICCRINDIKPRKKINDLYKNAKFFKFRILDFFFYWNGSLSGGSACVVHDTDEAIYNDIDVFLKTFTSNSSVSIRYSDTTFYIYGSYVVGDTLVFCGKPNVKTVIDLAKKDFNLAVKKFKNIYDIDITYELKRNL